MFETSGQTEKKSKKVTVRFPKRLKSEMQKAIINSGLGLHGKSQWVQEAIALFLQQSNYVELVEHGIESYQAELANVEAFYLKNKIITDLKEALVKVREKHPMIEGVQSAFIRAAIVFRLMLNK